MKAIIFGILALIFLVGIFILIFGLPGILLSVACLLALVGSFFLQGLKQIPAQPPHKAVLTKWGKRQTIWVLKKVNGKEELVEVTWAKDEGWRFFPFCPFWYGYILVDVTKKNPDFDPQVVRAPDLGAVQIPVSTTYTPDPAHLIAYLDAKGEGGVNDILEDIVRQKLREWAIAAEEGPQTWEGIMKARDEAVLLLAKTILGDELPRIMATHNTISRVPTAYWFKHFYNMRMGLEDDPEKWEKLEQNWKTQAKKELDAEPKPKFIEDQVAARKKEIDELRRGNGIKKIPHLGIILNRLNLGEMQPLGELAKAAELAAKEQREQVAEKIEFDHIRKRITELRDLGFSPEQALEIVQTERGKVTKTVSEGKLNISQETRGLLEKIVPDIAKLFTGKGG